MPIPPPATWLQMFGKLLFLKEHDGVRVIRAYRSIPLMPKETALSGYLRRFWRQNRRQNERQGMAGKLLHCKEQGGRFRARIAAPERLRPS